MILSILINTFRKRRLLLIFIFIIALSFYLLISLALETPPSFAQSPSPTQNVFWVYGGSIVGDLQSGWTINTSYGGPNVCNATNKNPVYSPTNSISYTVTSSSRDKCELDSSTTIDITPYTYLTFYGQATRQQQMYGITLIGANGAPIGTQIPMASYGGVPIPGKWTVYNVLISDFNLPIKTIKGIQWTDLNGAAEPPVYFDDISFSSVRGELINPVPSAGPPAPPQPTPTRVPDYYPEISPWVYIIPTMIILLAVIFQ